MVKKPVTNCDRFSSSHSWGGELKTEIPWESLLVEFDRLNRRPDPATQKRRLSTNASHFLRNIGYRDLAILDRHILKNLVRFRVMRGLPKTLTPKRYLFIENRFQRFARQIGIPMDELDLLFWSIETGEILK